LASDGDLFVGFVAHRTARHIGVIEHDGHCSFRHSCLTLLIDQLLQVADPHLREVRDAQDKADGIQDVTLPGPVQTCYGVELWVKSRYHCLLSITLEAIDYYLLYVH
jgi:hypothetical protein